MSVLTTIPVIVDAVDSANRAIRYAAKNKPSYRILGEYGKGIAESVTINFARNGGKNCGKCNLKKNKECYGMNKESRHWTMRTHLQRKENDQSGLLKALASTEQKKRLDNAPWIRVSAFGSVPFVNQMNADEKRNMQTFIDVLKDNQNKVHFPVENLTKAKGYRKAFGIETRVSIGKLLTKADKDRMDRALKAGFKVSIVASPNNRSQKLWTILAKVVGRKLQKLLMRNHTAKLCPAIMGKAKCGRCKLCTVEGPDIIIYPEHA